MDRLIYNLTKPTHCKECGSAMNKSYYAHSYDRWSGMISKVNVYIHCSKQTCDKIYFTWKERYSPKKHGVKTYK